MSTANARDRAGSAAAKDRERTTRRLATGPVGYAVLVVVVIGLLVLGARRPAATSDATRIAHLEQIIRCPSCTDLSIAESEAPSATGLRNEVSSLVHAGWTDQAIEAKVESQFPGTLLVPQGGTGIALVLVPAGLLVLGGAVIVALVLRRNRARGGADDAADEALVAAALEDEGAGR